MMYTDPTEPKDGDFAAYVERLNGEASRTPGLVPRPGRVKAKAKTKTGARQPTRLRTPATTTQAGSAAPPDLDAAMQQMAGSLRGLATRLTRWMTIAGFALIIASLTDLWRLSPLPGMLLVIASLLLHKKLSKP